GAVLFQGLDDLGHGGGLLPDGDVEAMDAVLAGPVLLVDDGVDGNRGLAGLAVADDEFALAAADGNHRVDGLEAGHEGLVHGLALEHAGSLDLDAAHLAVRDGALAIDGLAQSVDHAADEGLAHGNRGDLAGGLHRVAFPNGGVAAEEGDTDGVLLQVQHHPLDAAREFQQLAHHGLVQAIDGGNGVPNPKDGADVVDVDLAVEVLQLGL